MHDGWGSWGFKQDANQRRRTGPPDKGLTKWQTRPAAWKQRYIEQRRTRRQEARDSRPEVPLPALTPEHVSAQMADREWAARLAAYEAGAALHPVTGEYVHESTLSANKRGALVAWRKGYRITDDGRCFNPKGVELFPSTVMAVVPEPKHNHNQPDLNRRSRQHSLTYHPRVLAALCFYGLEALHDDRWIHFRDGNPRNWAKGNLVLLDQRKSRTAPRPGARRIPRYRQEPAPRKANGYARRGKWLNREQAIAVRQLLDLGKTHQEVMQLLHERNVLLTRKQVERIDRGEVWR